MSKLAVSAAYLCTFSYNSLDAIVAYLINVGNIPLYQIICFRNVRIFELLSPTRQLTTSQLYVSDMYYIYDIRVNPISSLDHLLFGNGFG